MKDRLKQFCYGALGVVIMSSGLLTGAEAPPPAKPGHRNAVDIGTRRELFVDDFMVANLTGGAERRLHHPIPREIVLRFGKKGNPWEEFGPGYTAVVKDDDRILLYYNPSFMTDYRGNRETPGSQLRHVSKRLSKV